MTTVGMIGAGRWGSNWIRTLAGLPGTHLRWVCDVSPASLERIRQHFPQVQTTTRLDDLLDGLRQAELRQTEIVRAAVELLIAAELGEVTGQMIGQAP